MQADRTYGVQPRRILVLGGTGTIGRATVHALVARGHEVVCLARRTSGRSAGPHLSGAQLRACDVTDPASLARDGIRGERFDAVLSCLASRTGAPDDAWRIDHDAHLDALRQAQAAGIPHMILLSAICVQKPQLAFQKAKLAFEHSLIASGIDYSIVRPTAFFKSLSGQVERVRQGKPFVMFGDGTLTACKPISDGDLAAYLADCIDNPERRNRILPIGGPGPAITPRMQGEALFAMLGQPPRFKHVPVALLDAFVAFRARFEQSEAVGDGLLGEMAFADGDGHDENSLGGNELGHVIDFGLLQIEGAGDFGKNIAGAQFVGETASGRAGLRVHGAAVGNEHESVVGEIVSHSAGSVAWEAQEAKAF